MKNLLSLLLSLGVECDVAFSTFIQMTLTVILLFNSTLRHTTDVTKVA